MPRSIESYKKFDDEMLKGEEKQKHRPSMAVIVIAFTLLSFVWFSGCDAMEIIRNNNTTL